jgi:hypothetical protein
MVPHFTCRLLPVDAVRRLLHLAFSTSANIELSALATYLIGSFHGESDVMKLANLWIRFTSVRCLPL